MSLDKGPELHGDEPEEGPIPALVKAYIDEQVRKSSEGQGWVHKKRWRNSWRAASPITRGTFLLTSAIAVATIIYSIAAIFQLCKMSGQLGTMNKTYKEIRKQTKAAQVAAFAACENAQLAQKALIEMHNSGIDTNTVASTARVQALAAVESERPLPTVQFDTLSEFVRPISLLKYQYESLRLKYEVRNDGQTAAEDVEIVAVARAWPVKRKLDFSFPLSTLMRVKVPFLEKGAVLPQQQKGGENTPLDYGPYITDSEGHQLHADPRTMAKIFGSHEWSIFIYGKLTYVDFLGKHRIDFCLPQYFLNPGETESIDTQNAVKQCANHRAERKVESISLVPTTKLPEVLTGPPEVKCELPDQ